MESADLSLLVTLDALLQEASVTRAARRLGLSTPAVSHALAKLRDRLDDPLLVRAGRAMVLTPRAEALRETVRDAVIHAERVFEPPEEVDLATVERGFTLCSTDYVLAVLGDGLDARVRAEAPGVDLRFLLNAVDDPERLRRGDADLAIGIYGRLPPELRTRPLITDRLVCAVREDHPVVSGRRITLKQYTRLAHVQVAPRGRPGGYVDALLAERDLSRRVARAVPFFEAALKLAAASDYVVTIAERYVRAHAGALGLKVLEPPLPFEPYTLSMVWHPRFDADAVHRWLRGCLLDAAGDIAGLKHPKARRRL